MWFQPLIKPLPGTAARADITPAHQARNRAKLRAIRIGRPGSDEVRDTAPRSYDRQRPANRRDQNAEQRPGKHYPANAGDCSGHPLTACNPVGGAAAFTNGAGRSVGHFHSRISYEAREASFNAESSPICLYLRRELSRAPKVAARATQPPPAAAAKTRRILRDEKCSSLKAKVRINLVRR